MSRSWMIRFALAIALISAGMFASQVFTQVHSDDRADFFSLTPVVKTGDPRVGGGTFFDCDACDVKIAGEHGLNDNGQVVISGFAGNCGFGVYVVSNRTGFPIVDGCHPPPFGFLSLFIGANINDQGQVALNMGPAVNNRIVDMIMLYSDGQLSKIVADGDLTPRGPVFGDCGFSNAFVNNAGTVAFSGCSKDGPLIWNGIFKFADGMLQQVVQGGDPSPLGGVLSLNLVPPPRVSFNDNGDVLFQAGQLDPDPTAFERFGLFLATAEGIKKVELSRDIMPNGSRAADNSIGLGTLNNKGDVVFSIFLAGDPIHGKFLYSDGKISTIVVDGQPTPIGGTFNFRTIRKDVDDVTTKINDNGAVAFISNVTDGSSPVAIFLASPRAIVKVVAIGDRLPTGEKIKGINSFALNNLGQVAFFANGSSSILNPEPLGVYLATPNPPQITSIRLKTKKSGLQLRVNGDAMIANDTVIEIDGVSLEALEYPTDFRVDGGFTTRVVSRDPRLEQLLAEGQPVQITVFNSLTNLRSEPMTFTR